MGNGDAYGRWGSGSRGRGTGEQGRLGPFGTRPMRWPGPCEPGRGAQPDSQAEQQGSRVQRRIVLAALGGMVITGTGGAIAAAMSGGGGPASGGPPSGRKPAAPPRHVSTTAHHEGGNTHAGGAHAGGAHAGGAHGGGAPGGRGHGHPRGGEAPAKPVFFIDDGPKTVALTIDDGPSPVYTPQILRILERHGITATFSMVGQNVAYYPAIAREVARAGHKIANHTWSHANLAALRVPAMQEEIRRATGELHAVLGQQPTVFRAPYGAWSPAVLDYCAAHGLTALDWSVDPRDWARPGVSSIVQDILRTTRSGSIILEHDGGGDRSQTVAALQVVLPRLLDEGYKFRQP